MRDTMVDRRFNNNTKSAAVMPTPAPSPPLTLEQRAVTALTDGSLTSAQLAALVEQTTAALAEAEQLAAAEKAKAFDPVQAPDPRVAYELMVDAGFKADRLRTLLPRLQHRLAEVVRNEQAAAWIAERDQFAVERCSVI